MMIAPRGPIRACVQGPQATHPLASQAKVLLTSVFGPYAQDDQYGSRSQLEGRVREALEIIEPGSITVSSVDVETDADRAKVRLMAHAKPVRSFDPVLGDLADTAQHVRLLLKFQHEGQAWRIIHSEVLLSTMN